MSVSLRCFRSGLTFSLSFRLAVCVRPCVRLCVCACVSGCVCGARQTEVELVVEGQVLLRFASAYGFRNIQTLTRKLKTPKVRENAAAAGDDDDDDDDDGGGGGGGGGGIACHVLHTPTEPSLPRGSSSNHALVRTRAYTNMTRASTEAYGRQRKARQREERTGSATSAAKVPALS